MTQHQLQRLLDLLLQFSTTTEPSEGTLRDKISELRWAVYDRKDG